MVSVSQRAAKLKAIKVGDLDLFVNIFSAHETCSILKIDFAHSNWPHFLSAYVIGICVFLPQYVNKIAKTPTRPSHSERVCFECLDHILP